MFKQVILLLIVAAVGSKSYGQTDKVPVDTTTSTTISIKVKGVTCSNDLKTLSNNVKDLKGVTECKPGKAGPVSEFQVSFNPALIGTKEIFKAIENTGGCSDPNDRPYKVKTN